jgi:DNA-directed RNA polymerase subunit M/transcription elongation factor TFIIS
MTTVIECSECHDLVDVTADTISLPFVCLSCDNVAKAEEQFTKQEYVDMAPSVKATASTVTAEPTEEFATVENTTLLIEDLEAQVRDLQEHNGWQVGEIDVLVDRVIAKDTQIANQAGTIKNLEHQNDTLLSRNIFQRLTVVELAKMVKFLKAEVDVQKNRAEIISAGLQSQIKRLEREKIDLTQNLGEKITRLEDENRRFAFGLNYWKRVSEGLGLLNKDEKNKSLWQCFKDRYFDEVTTDPKPLTY